MQYNQFVSWSLTSLRQGVAAEWAQVIPRMDRTALAEASQDGWKQDTPENYCHRCGASVGPGAAVDQGCTHCRTAKVNWHQAIRISAYQSPMRDWIVAFKFDRTWRWGTQFGRMLAHAIPQSPTGKKTAVVPVPMHWMRRWKRGYNQASLMARAIAHCRDWPLASILHRTRYTPQQTTVAPSSRPENVSGSFAIARVDLAGWHIWLVDDVKTTGSTANACCRLLLNAGAASVGLAVAAVADPKHADFQVM